MSLFGLVNGVPIGKEVGAKVTIIPRPPNSSGYGFITPLTRGILELYDSGLTIRGRRIFVESKGDSEREARVHEELLLAFKEMQYAMLR
jgi:hypothetical protein